MKKLSTRFEVSASNFWVRNVKTSEVGQKCQSRLYMYEDYFVTNEKKSTVPTLQTFKLKRRKFQSAQPLLQYSYKNMVKKFLELILINYFTEDIKNI